MAFARWPFWKRWFGRRSEKFAARYLRRFGWRILAANVADAKGEIDILALDGGTLVAVEVRSISGDDPQIPADTVDINKQKQISEAVTRYLSRHKLLGINVRFDILALAWPVGSDEPKVMHIPDAFQSTGKFQIFD